MPLATSYAEPELAIYMIQTIGEELRSHLGWEIHPPDLLGPLQKPVNDALRYYGVSLITDVTDPRRLERLAEYAVWDAAVTALLTTDYQTAANEDIVDSGSDWFSRAERRLKAAYAAVAADLAASAVPQATLTITPIRYNDRFSPRQSNEWGG